MPQLLSRSPKPLLAIPLLIAGLVLPGILFANSPAQSLVKLFMANWQQQSGHTQGNDCSDNWSPAITNNLRYLIPWFPENKAAYWMFGYDREQSNQELMLRLEGRFPHARYMSIHLYDGQTGKLVSGKNALKDIELAPESGHANPFRSGVARDTDGRDYALLLAPEGSAAAEHQNLIRIPDSVRYPLVVLRVYRADEGQSIDGGVGLPQVLAFNAQSGTPASGCPEPALPITEGLKSANRPDTRRYYNPDIHFYAKHPEYSGLFGNSHNYYGQTGLNRELGDVALMRFKAPTTPDTATGGGKFTHSEQLRYWSLCMGGDVFTNTSSCLWDDATQIDDKGYVKVAIGPDTSEFRAAAKAQGYNPMPWGYHLRHVVYHRHMQGEGDFSRSYKQAPHIDFSQPLNEQQADRFIGDYAPTGFYCEESAFIAGTCGFDSPNHALISTQ